MIKFFMLNNGMSLISKVEDLGDSFKFISPALVRSAPRENDQPQSTIVEPFVPHVLGHTFKLSKSKLLFVADPVPGLEDYYLKNNPFLAEVDKPENILPASTGNESDES